MHLFNNYPENVRFLYTHFIFLVSRHNFLSNMSPYSNISVYRVTFKQKVGPEDPDATDDHEINELYFPMFVNDFSITNSTICDVSTLFPNRHGTIELDVHLCKELIQQNDK